MRIVRCQSATDFLAGAEDWLLRAEAENNIAIGIARRFRAEPAARVSDAYWATVQHDDEIVGCAFQMPPHRLRVTKLPLESIPELVDDVCTTSGRVPGVGGPISEAEHFAETWSRRFDVAWQVHTRLRLHILTRVVDPPHPPPGKLRPAIAENLGLVREWTRRFIREVDIIDDAEALAHRLLDSGRLYFWHDGRARCMVAAARDTAHGVCVNAVFTPEHERGRGYATAAVATLSRLMLAEGYRFCCLYTDIANPTSNAIYRRVGYEAIQDEIDIDFLEDAPRD
jgi:uncharacterized protein